MFAEPWTAHPVQATTTLTLDSVVQDLALIEFSVDVQTPSREVVQHFQAQPQVPGVVLLKQQQFWGMISRNRFWEHMSRPYSLELFLDRPISNLYPFIQTEAMRLPAATTIVEAAQKSLQRPATLLDEPIVVESAHQTYALLDAHQLLVAASQIHQLTAQLLTESSRQLEYANQELARLATADGLTGIANRRRFDEYLAAAIAACAQRQVSLALILADVDYFKRYNDRQGHFAGDACLQAIARCLQETLALNGEHLVARYGGEEFGLVLPEHDAAATRQMLEQIYAAIAAQDLKHPDSPLGERVTLSLGAVVLIPDAQTSLGQLIQNADRALYAAKQQGRDRYVLELR
ncbi:MAG: diguanylate cyclase domain-containing protein [Spirulinaceae cyanobacterium]